MYEIRKPATIRGYRDLLVNGILVLRAKTNEVEAFVQSNIKPLGLELKK